MLVLVFTFSVLKWKLIPTQGISKSVKKMKCTLSKLIDWAIPETGSNAK